MADRTIQILPGGQSSAPFTYTVPASSAFMLQAVRAVFDGSGAAAFLPCVQIYSDAGQLMVETLGTAVAAGGSADVSFFPLRRTVSAAAAANYAATVLTIGPTNTLRGYWRLGETVGNFADTSFYQPTHPGDMQIVGAGPNTRGVTGLLGPDNDDGAWRLETAGNPPPPYAYGQIVGTAATPFAGTQTALTVVGWVKPTATIITTPTFRGSILNNASIVAGSPSYEQGWTLELYWPGSTANPSLRFTRSTDAIHGGQVVASVSGLDPAFGYMAAATYDGTSIRLYLNGVLQTTVADAPRSIPQDGGPARIGWNVGGFLYGIVDEVALWATVLADADIFALYSAGVS